MAVSLFKTWKKKILGNTILWRFSLVRKISWNNSLAYTAYNIHSSKLKRSTLWRHVLDNSKSIFLFSVFDICWSMQSWWDEPFEVVYLMTWTLINIYMFYIMKHVHSLHQCFPMPCEGALELSILPDSLVKGKTPAKWPTWKKLQILERVLLIVTFS